MDRFTPALSAIQDLFEAGFMALDSETGRDALLANTEIEHTDTIRKKAAFFRSLPSTATTDDCPSF